jgi:hypothetical protein
LLYRQGGRAGDQPVESVGLNEVGVVELVLAVQEFVHLGIKDLPCHMVGLLENGSAELRVGVIAEILPSSTNRLPAALSMMPRK